MAVATIRVAVDDPLVVAEHNLPPETIKTGEEQFFLDGPVSARIAVIDRDPRTGRLAPSVRWDARKNEYICPDDIASREATAASVFGLVLKTLSVVERPDVLAHKVKWGFDWPQLLIVPRAGTWENAFYDRYSRSLQFFSFQGNGLTCRTALSRDIVTHETGHAILDGLAPALYDALTPETLALHEAVGDFTAISMALESKRVRDWLVAHNEARIHGSTFASQLANQFGVATAMNRPLRDAYNNRKLADAEREPHDLAEVLTGAVWAAMTQLHDRSLRDAPSEAGDESTAGRALGISARRIARILFRALHYLPPAEATFADYARALLRADSSIFPDDGTGFRARLAREFDERGIARATDLDRPPEVDALPVDLDDVAESEWAAYAFAEKHRTLLGIPRRVPFRLLPRRDVMRRYHVGPNEWNERREVVFQLTWEKQEPNVDIPGLGRRRAVFQGATLVFGGDRDRRGRYPVLSCLASDQDDRHVRQRNDYLRWLVEQGYVTLASKWDVGHRRPFAPSVFGRVSQGTLRLRGTARLLHLRGDEP